MKLNDFYDTVVKIGIKNDPRGLKAVQEKLKENRQQFKKLATKEKRFFDKQELTNPYADTRILNGSRELMVNKVMVGIDIDVSEVLLFDRLNKNNKSENVPTSKIFSITSFCSEGLTVFKRRTNSCISCFCHEIYNFYSVS